MGLLGSPPPQETSLSGGAGQGPGCSVSVDEDPGCCVTVHEGPGCTESGSEPEG